MAPDSSEALAVRRVGKNYRSDRIPNCAKCGKPMALRIAQKGKNAGKQFWGCTGYPECRHASEI